MNTCGFWPHCALHCDLSCDHNERCPGFPDPPPAAATRRRRMTRADWVLVEALATVFILGLGLGWVLL